MTMDHNLHSLNLVSSCPKTALGTPWFHPQSNGAEERSLRVVKDALVKQVLEGKQGISMKRRLVNFLFRYCTTPQITTGVAPAELKVKRL